LCGFISGFFLFSDSPFCEVTVQAPSSSVSMLNHAIKTAKEYWIFHLILFEVYGFIKVEIWAALKERKQIFLHFHLKIKRF